MINAEVNTPICEAPCENDSGCLGPLDKETTENDSGRLGPLDRMTVGPLDKEVIRGRLGPRLSEVKQCKKKY